MRIAAIDIGTNSVHMIVCRIRPDLSFEVVDSEKDMIRLGAGGLEGRTLPETNMAVAMQTLAKFRRLAESHGVDEIIAAATSAVREAKNGADFITAVQRDVGVRVRVISGTEEARLIHQAAVYATGVGARPAVVIDIGGGSTEITLGTSARMQLGRSFRLGAIRLTERFVKSDPLERRDERRLVKHIRREAGSFIKQVLKRRFEKVIGTSGTILALGALAAGRPGSAEVRNLRVSARSMTRLRKELLRRSLAERLKMPGLDPRRADLAVAGVVLVDTLLELLGAEELTLCDFALREGLVLEYIQKNQAHIRKVERYPDVRRRSVIELAERFNYLADHAQQVARLSLALLDATKRDHGLGDREREWLEYGALLHDIGVHISYERHHKHSYYLIKNGDLRGFDPTEIEIIALLARYHRQATPKKSHEGYGTLSRSSRRTVRVLAAVLRLAEGLDRSHAQAVSNVTVERGEDALIIRLHAAGDSELELWAAHRHATALAEELETEIRFETVPSTDPAARKRIEQTRAALPPPPVSAPPAPTSIKDVTAHARHPQHATHVRRPTVRRRRDRRLRKVDAARAARQMAGSERA